MTSISELVAWLADQHQVSDASADHWRSLVGDVATAVAACGPRLRGVVLDGYQELEEELAAIRNQLRDLRGAPDRSLLRRLNRVADHLTERGFGSSARSAALDDLLEVAGADDLALSEDRARALADLGPGAGWPTREFARRMHRALRDGGDEALVRARQVAERDESRADRIVWLRYRVARIGEHRVMTVGPRVTLLDGDWVASALEDPSSELAGIAPEAAAATTEIQSLARRHGDPETGEERPPFVVARIEVPDVRPGEALDRARQTADTLAALGVLYGSDPASGRSTHRTLSTRTAGTRPRPLAPTWRRAFLRTLGWRSRRTAQPRPSPTLRTRSDPTCRSGTRKSPRPLGCFTGYRRRS